jgi:hypothetical protein
MNHYKRRVYGFRFAMEWNFSLLILSERTYEANLRARRTYLLPMNAIGCALSSKYVARIF